MKKAIAYIGAWTCYYMGDLISRLLDIEIFSFLYSTYQRLMNWSLSIQEWGGLDEPWEKPEVFEESED